ncbi:MAG TPA: hypothetical protein DCW97_04335 [Acidobacteria bacterium]|nr:hypothetical protein [Acidobacteriota bacterium]
MQSRLFKVFDPASCSCRVRVYLPARING